MASDGNVLEESSSAAMIEESAAADQQQGECEVVAPECSKPLIEPSPSDPGVPADADKNCTTNNNDDGNENNSNNNNDEGEGAVDVGFLVDKINTVPYQKAVERGEVPFCAFSPISTDELFLLRIQNCFDSTRHMLVPANKEEVFSTPGAVKAVGDGDEGPGNENAMNYQVAIVAIARQVYSEEQKQLFVSVDPLLKKDKRKIQFVKFLTVDKFADFAFAGIDGNVSEFAKKSKHEDRNSHENAADQAHHHHHHRRNHHEAAAAANMSSPPPIVPKTEKTPPKAPARRGRGGRRGRGRRSSPPMHRSPPGPGRRGHHHRSHRGGGVSGGGDRHSSSAVSQQQAAMMMHNQQEIFQVAFQPNPGTSSDCLQGFVKLEDMEGMSNGQQFFTQVHQMPADSVTFTAEQLGMPLPFDIPVGMPDVPMAFNEVTVGQTGSEADAPPPNHDIFTIAIDQLMTLTGVPEAEAVLFQSNAGVDTQPVADSQQVLPPERGSTTSSRGGKRPGRKPGRKSQPKDRSALQDLDDNAKLLAADVKVETKPVKRRGRPPKNKAPVVAPAPVPVQENDNTNNTSSVDVEEFESYEKRMKVHILGNDHHQQSLQT